MRHLISIATLIWLTCVGAAMAERVTVFAAASLKGPLDIIVAEWAEQSDIEVVVSYGSSAALARQILQGAPADIFISANRQWMDAVGEDGLLLSRIDLLSNSLVLVAPEDGAVPLTPDGLRDALGGGRLAVGFTNSVPAGIYAKASLEHLGLWVNLQPHLAETDNVRAALALVARGETPLGIVYASDAMAEPRVHVVAEFDAQSHPLIVYPAGLIDETGSGFFSYLQRGPAMTVFAMSGFEITLGESR